MSTYAETRAAIIALVDTVTGLTPSTVQLTADIPATGADGWFVVNFLSGSDYGDPVLGDDVATTRHVVTVEWLQQVTAADWNAQVVRALDRVDAIRKALRASAALAGVASLVLWRDYQIVDTGGPYMVVAVGLEVTQHHSEST